MSTKRTTKPRAKDKTPDRTKEFVQVNHLLLKPFLERYRDNAMRDEMEGQVIATGIAIKQLDSETNSLTKSLAKLELIKLEEVCAKAVDANPDWAKTYLKKQELADFFSAMKKAI
jgi:hypothetical protein